jgi:DNA-binding transcriptional ArsR family regulator
MLRNLHLTALRAFEAATRTGSFRLAADDLGLTPSAVSHAIRGLEQDLGTVLFEREGRSIRRRYRLNLDTDSAAADGALILELCDHILHVGAGIEKAMPTLPPDGGRWRCSRRRLRPAY